jgi:acetyl esterase/lipase
MPIQEFRKIVDSAGLPHPALRKVTIEDRKIANVDCMIVEPVSSSDIKRVLVYFHGGGYVLGSPNGYKSFLAQLALNSNCRVIAPDYRLAPEHPFPAPQDDCLAVARNIFSNHSKHTKILAGDSAGGALALMAALELNQHSNNPIPDACLLISPWVDPRASTGTMLDNQLNDFLTQNFLQKSLTALIDDQTLSDPRLNFTEVDLSALPRTLLQCGTGELFYDQDQAFAQRASAAGVDLTLECFSGQFHVFQVVAPMFKDAKNAMTSIQDFIDRD